jgi:hypothetical protein
MVAEMFGNSQQEGHTLRGLAKHLRELGVHGPRDSLHWSDGTGRISPLKPVGGGNGSIERVPAEDWIVGCVSWRVPDARPIQATRTQPVTASVRCCNRLARRSVPRAFCPLSNWTNWSGLMCARYCCTRNVLHRRCSEPKEGSGSPKNCKPVGRICARHA